MTQSPVSSPATLTGFAQRALILAAIVAAALLIWTWLSMLLLVFGSVLIAIFLRAVAKPISDHTPLGPKWAVGLVLVVVLALLGAAFWLFGTRISDQFSQLIAFLPGAWTKLQGRLANDPLGRQVLASIQSIQASNGSLLSHLGGVLPRLTSLARAAGGAATDLLLVLVAGVFIALSPQTYRGGMLRLTPPRARQSVGEALDDCGRALRSWLLGQGIGMAAVGVITGLGLWWIGVPAPFALGLIAGLADFVPYAGPVLSAAPALLLAFTVGIDTVLWTLGLYVAVQQLEGIVLLPLIQKHEVSLPPAIIIFSVVGFGLLLGPLGVLFATPIAVVAEVMIGKFWVESWFGEKVNIPGAAKQ